MNRGGNKICGLIDGGLVNHQTVRAEYIGIIQQCLIKLDMAFERTTVSGS